MRSISRTRPPLSAVKIRLDLTGAALGIPLWIHTLQRPHGIFAAAAHQVPARGIG